MTEQQEVIVSNDNPNEPVVETKVESDEVKTEEPEGLSLRDALEVGIETFNDKEGVSIDGDERKREKKDSPEAPKRDRESHKEGKQDSPLQPPAEWDAEDKTYFFESTRKQQEAALKLHHKRQAALNDLRAAAAEKKAAAQEYETYKRLADEVAPYLKSIGDKRSPYEAITLALKMRNEFEQGDPKQAAAAYLKAKGVAVPRDLITQESIDQEKFSPLQQRLSQLESKLAEQEQLRLREQQEEVKETLASAYVSFQKETNAAGAPKYPDLSDTEAGLRLVRNIGSLVNGATPLSQQFIANVNERIPGATYSRILEEAYKYHGGRVDESDTPRSQTSQNQIAKSRRAASSVPGGSVQSTAPVKRYKSTAEALAAAYSDYKQKL